MHHIYQRATTVFLAVALLVLALVACGVAPDSADSNAPTPDRAPTSPTLTFAETTATPAAGATVITTTSRRPLPGELFSIQGGETMFVDVQANVGGNTTVPLRLRFDAVLKDERCPRLVACVVRGDAVIVIVAQIGQGGQPQTLQLHTDPSLDQSHAVYEGYDISLVELEPTVDYPGDTLDLGNYTAHLIVTSITAAPPTVQPAPGATPAPSAFDACVLAENTTITKLVGAIQGVPVSSGLPAYGGQQCVIQAERATVTLRLYTGDTATAQALVADAQAAGTHFSELSTTTGSLSAVGDNQGQAVMIQQSNEAIFLIELAFNNQSQPNDHAQAYVSLDTLQTMALVRYIGVLSGQIEVSTPQATP